jgi:hypothetical protein
MSAGDDVAPLFPVPVIRTLLRNAIKKLTKTKDYTAWAAVTLGRFAAWAAAVEGAVDLAPEVVELLEVVVKRGDSNTYADFQGPLDVLEAIVSAAPHPSVHDALTRHRSALVRWVLARRDEYRPALRGDPDPAVRVRARFNVIEARSEPDWWVGSLSIAPPNAPGVAEFGELTRHFSNLHDWSEGWKVAEAFKKMPSDLARRIAPAVVSSLWAPSAWVDAVWPAIVGADRPLDERVALAAQIVDRLIVSGPCVEPAHASALDASIAACRAEERDAFAPIVERLRTHLEPSDREERKARWAARPRKARSERGARARGARVPPALFERLVDEIHTPGAWGASRLSLHPRARFELGRGLHELRGLASIHVDEQAIAEKLADVVARCIDRRPTAEEGILLALAGLLGAIDLADPIHLELWRHPVPAVREAVALSARGADAPHVEPLLVDPDPRVWTAARMAVASREPWRGPLASDPLDGCLPDEAESLVPTLIALDRAVPSIRHATFEDEDYASAGRAASMLPGCLARDFVRRILPDHHLDKSMALLAAAQLAAEGGWDAWVAEIARRSADAENMGTWFGGPLVSHAVEHAAAPPDGGPPIPWPLDRRRAAGRDALARFERAAADSSESSMWLTAACALWPDDDDPLPLPGPWLGKYPPYQVIARLKTMRLRPEWGSTHVLMEGARSGFGEPWSFWHHVGDILDRLPPDLRRDAALEGFAGDGGFGDWSRRVLGEALVAAHEAGPSAVTALLDDTRLAPHQLLLAGRSQHTLFVLRARLVAGQADLAEALLTLTLVALDPKSDPWMADERAAWRARWTEAMQAAMAQGAGGARGALLTLAPPGMWEPLDRSFVHAVAVDATAAEAEAIARRLSACGDADDLAVAGELAVRHPTVAPWERLRRALADRGTRSPAG